MVVCGGIYVDKPCGKTIHQYRDRCGACETELQESLNAVKRLVSAGEPVDDYAASVDKELLRAVAKAPSLRADSMISLLKNSRGDMPSVLMRPDLPDEVVEYVIEDGGDLANTLVQNDSLSGPVLSRLAQHESVRVRQRVAKHPGLPQDVFSVLAEDEESVRCIIAEREDTPPTILHNMGFSLQFPCARKALENPSCPPETLRKIGASHFDDTRRLCAVARNPAIPKDLLAYMHERFKGMTEASARETGLQALASNPRTPPDVLWEILAECGHKAAHGIATNHAATPEMLDEALNLALARGPLRESRLVEAYISNPNMSDENLADLLASTDERCHGSIVRHRNSGRKVIITARRLNCTRAMSAIVESKPRLDPETLSWYALHHNRGVRASVADHPNATRADLERLSGSSMADIRVAVARNRSTSPDILMRFFDDENPNVRQAVASNPSLPQQFLKLMQYDENSSVRLYAQRTLKEEAKGGLGKWLAQRSLPSLR